MVRVKAKYVMEHGGMYTRECNFVKFLGVI